ncbi:hypothetical protein [Methyloversatilis universalis]|uniref:hypothetical protein n=1 Tax=Methyloversatilis universalis TaxID=378211 RepID=UPI0012F75B35|nr:hypothetical protein [Methyloversatilis universalis]
MDERWFSLLTYWQKYEFRHALTFPFLIGALRIPVGARSSSDDQPRKELETLVDVMRSHRANGYFHHVYRCPDIGQLVVTKVTGSVPPVTAVAITSGKENQAPSLFASGGVSGSGSTPFDSLVTNIWSEVGTAIEAGNFSCRGRQFAAFNESELNVIGKALAQLGSQPAAAR